jgi:hypothetical protein
MDRCCKYGHAHALCQAILFWLNLMMMHDGNLVLCHKLREEKKPIPKFLSINWSSNLPWLPTT